MLASAKLLLTLTFVAASCNQVVGAGGRDLQADRYRDLDAKPLHGFTHTELAEFLKLRIEVAPPSSATAIRESTAYYVHKSSGTSFALDGSLPDLRKINCVSLVNRCLALACARSWEDYYLVSTRLYYKDGVIARSNANHFTETQWVPNNSWLLEEITSSLGGESSSYRVGVPQKERDRALFEQGWSDTPPGNESSRFDRHTFTYLPNAAVRSIRSSLRPGDIVLLITKLANGSLCCTHLAILVEFDGGLRISVSGPVLKISDFHAFTYSRFAVGMRILRLRDDSPARVTNEIERLRSEEHRLPTASPAVMDEVLFGGVPKRSSWFNIDRDELFRYWAKRELPVPKSKDN